MNAVLARLWLWFWHLLPANPILVRVVHGGSRRTRHLWLRVGYLGALLVVVAFSLMASTGGETASLEDLAKGASQTFKWASLTQLALVCFIAPAFTASAITQERDAQTFNILTSTPLTNAQIVFGSLMSRLFFVIMLLVSGLPIFLMTMIYGGVTTSQIFDSFAISGATAVLTGSIAISVAMTGVGTRRTIFSFYLVIALYLILIYVLGNWNATWVEEAPAAVGNAKKMSWLTPLHPFLALMVALNIVKAPQFSDLTSYGSFSSYALAYPSATYVIWTLVVAFILTAVSIFFVRRGAKIGEKTFLSPIIDRFRRTPAGERTRPPRHVWNNPVAWREAKTRASGGGVMRVVIFAGGLVGVLVLFVAQLTGSVTAGAAAEVLATMIVILFVLALLIATNTAATSMTKEKESKSMDILLTTRLTSKYILWGKLRGLVSFTAPLIVLPAAALILFGGLGMIQSGPNARVWIESAVETGVLMLVYCAFACVVSLQISLKSRSNMTAVMYSVGTILLLGGIMSVLGFAIVRTSAGPNGEIAGFFAPFSPFTSIWYLVNPVELFDNNVGDFQRNATSARLFALVGSAIATAVYAFIVFNIYNSLVKNFDMIIRKQSGT